METRITLGVGTGSTGRSGCRAISRCEVQEVRQIRYEANPVRGATPEEPARASEEPGKKTILNRRMGVRRTPQEGKKIDARLGATWGLRNLRKKPKIIR